MGPTHGDDEDVSVRALIENIAGVGMDEEDGGEAGGRGPLPRAVGMSYVSGSHGRRGGSMGCGHVLVQQTLAAGKKEVTHSFLLRECLPLDE